MDIFAQLAERIIQEQETIIGPIALEQAKKVPGIEVDWQKKEVKIQGDEQKAVEQLIEKYRDFFGNASVEVCREAVKSIIGQVPAGQMPPLLVK